MKKTGCIIAVLLLLTACETNDQDKAAIKEQLKEDTHTAEDNAKRHTMRVANNVRDQVKKTAQKMREWWLEPLPQQAIPAVPPSYCYQVMQDIVCYRQPVPGKTQQLVGYQGDNAAPPPLAQTAALPMVKENSITASGKPEVRVKTAKPVFVGIPVQPKQDKNTSALDEAAALGNEPLPNPMLSPQL